MTNIEKLLEKALGKTQIAVIV